MDFEKRIENIHEKYESQIIEVLLKTISELNSEISGLNRKLSNTINTIGQPAGRFGSFHPSYTGISTKKVVPSPGSDSK